MVTRIAIAIVSLTAACGRGPGSDARQPAPRIETNTSPGLVLAAGNASAAGGHRVVAGVLGGGGETKSVQHVVTGGLQP